MKPPWVFEKARREAPIHAQLRILHLGAQPEQHGSVAIVCRVVRIFRDDAHSLRKGARVRVRVSVTGRNRSDAPALDGTIYHAWQRIESAEWIEVFLCPSDDGVELVESQLAPIRRPSREPVCDPEEPGFLCAGDLDDGDNAVTRPSFLTRLKNALSRRQAAP